MEIDAVYGHKGQKGKDKCKGKHKGKHESSRKFEGCCGHCGKWGHKQKKTVGTRTLLPKWMRRTLSNIHTAARAAARPESNHHLLACLQLELRNPRRDRFPRRWRLTRSLAGSVNLWWDLMMHERENVSMSSLWWIREQPSMSVDLTTSHTLH